MNDIMKQNIDYLTKNMKNIAKNKKSQTYLNEIINDMQLNLAGVTEEKDEYGPVKGRCKKGYRKDKTTKMCKKKGASPNKTLKNSPKLIKEKLKTKLDKCNDPEKIKELKRQLKECNDKLKNLIKVSPQNL